MISNKFFQLDRNIEAIQQRAMLKRFGFPLSALDSLARRLICVSLNAPLFAQLPAQNCLKLTYLAIFCVSCLLHNHSSMMVNLNNGLNGKCFVL